MDTKMPGMKKFQLAENADTGNLPPSDNEYCDVLTPNYVNELLDCQNSAQLYQCIANKNLPITMSDAQYIFDEVDKYKRNLLEQMSSGNGKLSEISPEKLAAITGGGKNTDADTKELYAEETTPTKKASTKKKPVGYYLSRPTYYMGYGVGATAKTVPLIPIFIKSMILGIKDQLLETIEYASNN